MSHSVLKCFNPLRVFYHIFSRIKLYFDLTNMQFKFLSVCTKHWVSPHCAVRVKNFVSARSTEVLPFYMILANFVVSGLWCIYGMMLDDNFIKIPNFMGLCLATVQLVPFVIFRNKSANEIISDETDSEKELKQ